MIKVNNVFSFFVIEFSIEIKKQVLLVFIGYNGDMSGNLGEFEKAMEMLACLLVFPQHFSFSQTPTCVSISREKTHRTLFLFVK